MLSFSLSLYYRQCSYVRCVVTLIQRYIIYMYIPRGWLWSKRNSLPIRHSIVRSQRNVTPPSCVFISIRRRKHGRGTTISFSLVYINSAKRSMSIVTHWAHKNPAANEKGIQSRDSVCFFYQTWRDVSKSQIQFFLRDNNTIRTVTGVKNQRIGFQVTTKDNHVFCANS